MKKVLITLDTNNKSDYKPLKHYNAETLKKNLMKVFCNHKKSGIESGYILLDEKIGGFQKGEFVIVGARTSIGKTAFALNIAENIVERNISVGFFSLEMSGGDLHQRLTCGKSGVSQKKIKQSKLKESEYIKLKKSVIDIENYPLYIADFSYAPITDIKSKARTLKRKEGIEILFIDYLGRISIKGDGQRWEKYSQISSELKSLAKELDIPIVVLSQVGRQSENKAPSLADLRDSGSIEQDADVVILLHRNRNSSDTSLEIAKNRNGGTGKVSLSFDFEGTKFKDV